MLRAILALPFLLLLPQGQDPKPAHPEDTATVASTVQALYAVISGPKGQARDWPRMQNLFHADARLVPVVKGKDKFSRAVPMTVADYVQRSGPLLEQNGFFEQEIAQRSEAFGDFAHVWSTYESRQQLDDKEPFMRGINSIQLVRQQGRWWVLQVLWEQEHDAGPIPVEYLPAK